MRLTSRSAPPHLTSAKAKVRSYMQYAFKQPQVHDNGPDSATNPQVL